MSHPGFERIGFFRLLVLHQLDGSHQSILPDVPDMGQLLEWLEEARHRFDLGLQLRERLLFLEHFKIGQGHGTAELVACIAVAMEEGFEVFVLAEKPLIDLFGGYGRGQGHVAAGQAFTDRH